MRSHVRRKCDHKMSARQVSNDDAPGLEEQAYRHLRAALVKGVFAPGERLSIRRVAASLGTSAMPVRGALRLLATEQALEIGPSGSASVPRLTRAAFLELSAIRAELEPLAVRLAGPHLSSGVLDQLGHLARVHTNARDRGDAEALLRADREFLFKIYRAARAPLLLGLIEALWLRRVPVFWDARWMLISQNGTGHRHEEIVVSLRKGEIETAYAALRHEIQGATDYIAEHLSFADDPRPTPSLQRIRPAEPTF